MSLGKSLKIRLLSPLADFDDFLRRPKPPNFGADCPAKFKVQKRSKNDLFLVIFCLHFWGDHSRPARAPVDRKKVDQTRDKSQREHIPSRPKSTKVDFDREGMHPLWDFFDQKIVIFRLFWKSRIFDPGFFKKSYDFFEKSLKNWPCRWHDHLTDQKSTFLVKMAKSAILADTRSKTL